MTITLRALALILLGNLSLVMCSPASAQVYYTASYGYGYPAVAQAYAAPVSYGYSYAMPVQAYAAPVSYTCANPSYQPTAIAYGASPVYWGMPTSSAYVGYSVASPVLYAPATYQYAAYAGY